MFCARELCVLRAHGDPSPSRIEEIHGYTEETDSSEDTQQDHEACEVRKLRHHRDDALSCAEGDNVLATHDDNGGGAGVLGDDFCRERGCGDENARK